MEVGKGATGTVYKGTNINSHKIVGIKCYPKILIDDKDFVL